MPVRLSRLLCSDWRGLSQQPLGRLFHDGDVLPKRITMPSGATTSIAARGLSLINRSLDTLPMFHTLLLGIQIRCCKWKRSSRIARRSSGQLLDTLLDRCFGKCRIALVHSRRATRYPTSLVLRRGIRIEICAALPSHWTTHRIRKATDSIRVTGDMPRQRVASIDLDHLNRRRVLSNRNRDR